MKLYSTLLMFFGLHFGEKRQIWYLNPILGTLGVTHDLGRWLVGKPIVDFLFVLIELYSLSIPVPELWSEMFTNRLFLQGVCGAVKISHPSCSFKHVSRIFTTSLHCRSPERRRTNVKRFDWMYGVQLQSISQSLRHRERQTDQCVRRWFVHSPSVAACRWL